MARPPPTNEDIRAAYVKYTVGIFSHKLSHEDNTEEEEEEEEPDYSNTKACLKTMMADVAFLKKNVQTFESLLKDRRPHDLVNTLMRRSAATAESASASAATAASAARSTFAETRSASTCTSTTAWGSAITT